MKPILLMSLAFVSGCGQGNVDLKNASVDDVAKITKQAKMLNPGQWENETEVVSVDIPGLSGQEKAAMQAMGQALVGKKKLTKNCITPEQAKEPSADMLAGDASSKCKFETFSMSGGKMDAVMKCTDPAQRGSMTMKMNGIYGGDSYAMTSEINMAGAPGMHGGMGMVIKSKNSGKRVGVCATGIKE